MREKQNSKRIPFDVAVQAVLRWHLGEATQVELADELGIAPAYFCRVCHGDSRPEVYEAVKAEFERLEAEANRESGG